MKMAKTLQGRFIEALEMRGETLVKRTHKKIVYSRAEGGYWYLGSRGSIRIGRNLVTSILASPGTIKALLGE
jgi:hypothetical protein